MCPRQNCRPPVGKLKACLAEQCLGHMIKVGGAKLLLVYLLYRQSFGESQPKRNYFL